MASNIYKIAIKLTKEIREELDIRKMRGQEKNNW